MTLNLNSLIYFNFFQVIDALKKDNVKLNTDSSVILLEGGDTLGFYDTDTDYIFKQVRFKLEFILNQINNNLILKTTGIIFSILVWSH